MTISSKPPRRRQQQRHQFVFLYACGCVLGLVEQTPRCRNEDGAWTAMFDTRADERAALRKGVRVEHVDHATYVRDFYPLMTSKCTHLGGAA